MPQVIPMVTKKKISIEYTQTVWKGNRNVSLQENQLNTKEGSNGGK